MATGTPNSVLLGMTDKELTDYCHISNLTSDQLIADLVNRLDAALKAIADAAAVAEELTHSYHYDCDITELAREHLGDLRRVSADDRDELIWDIESHELSVPKIKRRPTPKQLVNTSKPGPKSNTLHTILAILRKAKSPMKRVDLAVEVMTATNLSQSAAYKAIAQAVKARAIRDIGGGQFQLI